MEYNHTPQQDTPEILPEILHPEPEADLPPVVADLTFSPDPEPVTLNAETPEAGLPEEPAPSEEPAVPEEAPVPEEIPLPEEVPVPLESPVPEDSLMAQESVPAAPSFMERFPDTEEPLMVQESVGDSLDDLLKDMDFLKDPEPKAEPVREADDKAYQDHDPEFDKLFHAEPKKEAPKTDVQRPSQKGRPKRKKGEGLLGIPNILVTVVWLALIVVIGTTLGRMLWVCAADVLAFGREDKPVTITIYEADSMDDIVDKLHDAGLIRYKSLFNLYAGISDAEEDIKPGIYDLNTRYDYHALVNFMSPSSTRQVIKLTIPEGYTCRQIFNLLEENRICTAVDLSAYAANGELSDYWFLEGISRGAENSLEGYLFPDTYEFYKNSTPREALEKMLDNFDHRFTEEMRAQIDLLNANVTGGGYTIQEITIIASLIEKESAAPTESANISGVIYNRLFNWEYPALLNIDASIVYAQGGEAETIDTGLDSPYNTYTNVGLTPGPIANPGLSSLQAALNPATHNYYYYVLNPETGMHAFATTQEEHNANIAAFYD